MLIWDNLNTHVSRRMHALIATRSWLTVIRLPAYAPDLNPTEGVWWWMKRGLTNIAAHGADHLADLVRQRLRACQQQTDLHAGFLASTGMTLDPDYRNETDLSLSTFCSRHLHSARTRAA